MPDTLLRTRDGSVAEVTSVELFFDLVFVITVSQISHALLEDLTWAGALQAGLLLLAIWWAWIDTAWVTNWLDPQQVPVRMMLFVLMGIGIVLSSSLPEAFGERGLYFAVAFVVFQVGRSLFVVWASGSNFTLRQNFIRIAIWYTASGVLWLAGGFSQGEMRLGLWIAALVLDNAGPALGFWIPGLGRSDTREWTVEGAHIAERSGLFVMIALGESVLATGVGFTELNWTTDVILAMTASLLQSIAIWTIYFGQDAGRASAAIARAADPGAVARLAYTYVPILLVAGIIVCAVGDDLALAHPSGHMETPVALVLIGGPLLFLLGAACFKLAVFGAWSVPRLAGLVALLALYPVAPMLTPMLLSASTTAVLIVVGTCEMVWLALHPEAPAERELAIELRN